MILNNKAMVISVDVGVVFDFETSNLSSPENTQVIQVACLAIDMKRKVIIDGSEFNSLIRPENPDLIEQKALDVNKKTREELALAPELPVVWDAFVRHVRKYSTKPNSPKAWDAPFAAGKNINNFDMPILRHLATRFGNVDKKTGGQNIFHPIYTWDVQDDMFRWHTGQEPTKLNMDVIREYYGMSKEGAHDALQDVKDTAAIMLKFLNLYRDVGPKVKFKGCFKNG